MDKKDWIRSFVELIIIFIGVYGAFLLNNYRQQNLTEQVQLKYYQTFLADLQSLQNKTDKLISQVETMIDEVETAESDALPYNRHLTLPNTSFIIKSAYESNNFRSLSTGYLINIEGGSNLIKHIERRFQILDEEVRNYILFKENNAKAEQEFKNWYINELKFILGLLTELKEAIEEGAIPATKELIAEME